MKMKILFIAFLSATIFTQFADAQTKISEPRTVTDFYLQMPADLIDDTANAAERRKQIAVEDLANGYLKLKPGERQGDDGYTEIALFKKSAGGYIVGIASIECAENCIGSASFYERRADRWVEVTNRIYPITREGELVLYRQKKSAAHRDYDTTQTFWTVDRLPRTGRTIRTDYTSEGAAKKFEIFSATWNGERFVPDRPLPAGIEPPVAPSDAVLSAAEKNWKFFFTELKTAVAKRDRKKLRTMMSDDFSYSCCDEPYPDHRNGAFTVWDGIDPKDYAGWKTLERDLRTETMLETAIDASPARMFGGAIFTFGADNRWHFTSFGANDTP